MENNFWKMACFLEFDYGSENNLEKIVSFGLHGKSLIFHASMVIAKVMVVVMVARVMC